MATLKLYTGTYINFYNGNAAEFLKTIVTTFICKDRDKLELTMFTYIMEDLVIFRECYVDDDGDCFESDEELYEYFRTKFPTFKEQINELKNFFKKQRDKCGTDYSDIKVDINEVQIDSDISCPHTIAIIKDGSGWGCE